MKNPILLAMAFLTTTLFLGLLAFTWLSRGPKIAYVETGALMAEFSAAKEAKKRFQEEQKTWDKNLAQLNDSLTAGMAIMQREYESSGPARKRELRALLEKRNEDLQGYVNAVKKLSEAKERELMEPVLKKFNSFLDRWGREHGYDLILGTLSGGNILQADSRLNVTARLLRDMNEHYRDLPAVSAAPSPAPLARATEKAKAKQ